MKLKQLLLHLKQIDKEHPDIDVLYPVYIDGLYWPLLDSLEKEQILLKEGFKIDDSLEEGKIQVIIGDIK